METSLKISIISLIISVIIGIISIIVMIKPLKYSLSISSIVEKFHSEINIIITNSGLRPINITSFSVGYGANQFNQQIIIAEKLDKPIKIEDGEIYEHRISRKKIIDAVKTKAIKQYYSQRLWIGVNLSNRKTVYKLTSIEPSIIKQDFLPNAAEYIAADLFIGFQQMESNTEFKLIVGLDKNDLRQLR